MNNIIFSLDPGSLRTGWAVMRPPEQLLAGGVIRPDKVHLDSEFRIASMCHDLLELLDEYQPARILIEYGSGKINPRRHHGGGQGMQTHGISVGAVWRECVGWWRSLPDEQQLQTKIILITENTWTRGVPKMDRQVAIAQMFREYKPDEDLGGDVSDAIGLGLYYVRERVVRLAECLT